MKKISIFLSLFLLLALPILAQQDAQYTQFMYNKLNYNPAYAGSLNATCATAIVRNQWIGLEGSPSSQVFNLDAALSEGRVGLGLNLVRYSIGIATNYNVDLSYTYRVPVGEGHLGIGLMGSMRSFSANYNDERLIATEGITTDLSIPAGQQSKIVPNFGAGVYYNDDRLYVGLSAPRFLENNIDFAEDVTVISDYIRHFYLMGGYLFEVNDKVGLLPQVLFKYTDNTPFDADLNLSVLFEKKYSVGLSYRVGGSSQGLPAESIDVLFNAQINEKLMFGIAYDVTVSEIRDYASGSIEAMLRYCFGASSNTSKEAEGDYLNPRFF